MSEAILDNLFSLASSLNAVVDRLSMVVDKLEDLLIKNEELLKQARQEVLQRIIEEAVELEIEKNRRQKQ